VVTMTFLSLNSLTVHCGCGTISEAEPEFLVSVPVSEMVSRGIGFRYDVQISFMCDLTTK
jgi:hypothetical protein